MMPRMSRLGTRLAPALALSTARPLLSGQSVGGRWLGGVGGVLLPSSQLPLQIRDLLCGVGDLVFAFGNLPFAFGYFTAELLVLSQQPLILPMQLFTAELVGVPMAIRRYLWSPCPASRSRTHPSYGKRFGEICPVKSTGVPELLRNPIRLRPARSRGWRSRASSPCAPSAG